MEKKYIVMLIEALMAIEKIESFIVNITNGHGITGKEFIGIENIYTVLWMNSRFKDTSDDQSFTFFEETICSGSISTEEKYKLLF